MKCNDNDSNNNNNNNNNHILFMGFQVIVFDLEFGQPAASTTLPASRSPFKSILGSFGHASAGRGLHGGGIDLLYCSHQVSPRRNM
jgi:hypothetical protein